MEKIKIKKLMVVANLCWLIFNRASSATTLYLLLTTYGLFAAGFELGAVRPKIITPNDDKKNDMLIVPYDNPNDSNISGRILTINGSYIADMLNNDDRITWDGKDDGGSYVPSGIYIYQIETEGQVFNGTVVVAK